MLSQQQSDAEPMSEPTTSCGKSGEAAAGAVTPGVINGADNSQEFLSTGRTGRRNAMPDILGQHATTSTADLPEKLEALTTGPSTSGSARDDAAAAGSSSTQQEQHAG